MSRNRRGYEIPCTIWLIVCLNLPSQFQFYLILTLSPLIIHGCGKINVFLYALKGASLQDVEGKLDIPGKVISKEAIEW